MYCRTQVRDARPTRERTMDEVEKRLLHQQALISTFIEKVKRAIGHVDKEVCQLESVKARLAADHKDKVGLRAGRGAVVRVCFGGAVWLPRSATGQPHPGTPRPT